MKLDVISYVKKICDEVDKVDWSDPKICAAYYAQIYYYVRHSTRLLALTSSRMSFDDEIAHRRLMKHTTEELSHEQLAARDAKSFGFDVADFPELPSIKAFYRSTYYSIDHVSPWAMMGYVLALECLAVEGADRLHQRITQLHGEGHSKFLKVHGEEDIGHVDDALRLVESRPANEIEIIRETLELSVYLQIQVFKDLPMAAAAYKKSSSRLTDVNQTVLHPNARKVS